MLFYYASKIKKTPHVAVKIDSDKPITVKTPFCFQPQV